VCAHGRSEVVYLLIRVAARILAILLCNQIWKATIAGKALLELRSERRDIIGACMGSVLNNRREMHEM